MRISTSQIQQNGVSLILEQQTKLNRTQNQVATGRRVLLPSDDPVATTQMLTLHETVDTVEQYQANGKAATNRLSTEEGILKGVTSVIQRVRELSIEALNATQTNETRKFIGAEVRQWLHEVVGLANTRDGNGEYLFSGSKGKTEPFSLVGNQYQYNGDQTERELKIGPGRHVKDGDSGADVFQMIRNGNGTFVAESVATNTGTGIIDTGTVIGSYVPSLPNGYSINFVQTLPTDPVTYEVRDSLNVLVTSGNYVNGQPIEFAGARVSIKGAPADGDSFSVSSSRYQDIFKTLDDLAAALEQPVNSSAARAQLSNAINTAISNMDQAMGNILVTRSSIGSRLSAIDNQTYINEGTILQTKEVLSSIEDLDYAEAISRLNIQRAGLEAAQQAYVKVNGLSLFNFIR